MRGAIFSRVLACFYVSSQGKEKAEQLTDAFCTFIYNNQDGAVISAQDSANSQL
jgi:hypothetical protein